jgi:hypothetical protein
MNCLFEGCQKKAMPGDDLVHIYRRFDLPEGPQLRMFKFCEEHGIQAAERAFRRLCGVTRVSDPQAAARLARLKEIEEQIKKGEKTALPKARRYPTDPASRSARLAAIQAEIDRDRAKEKEIDRKLDRMESEIKRHKQQPAAAPEPEINPVWRLNEYLKHRP